eukprot:TRINITY_DN43742_c0_g1_i1.p1 TRINITY_DN43742_c0_g1~~TRINITY_DN43742_c0_g1_i1.p1  ORF type:complete len:507 (+),score=124.78 TRINITY_DN43742_c0_g1_i1:69-1589(+)
MEDLPSPLKSQSVRPGALAGVAKEDVEIPPERLSLDDPRMLAAMKVHGVKREELSAASPPAPPSKPAAPLSPRKTVLNPSVDMQKRRQELWEQKRAELLAEVEETASMLDTQSAERILGPSGPASVLQAAGRTAGTKSDFEDAKIEALRLAAEKEAQKIVDDQRNKLTRLQQSAEKQEQVQQRLALQRKEAYQKLLERVQAREAKEAKKTEWLIKNESQNREANRAVMNKLKQSFQKVREHKQETLDNWHRVSEERSQHVNEVLERKVELQHAAREEVLRAFQEKESIISARMTEKSEQHGDHAAESQEKFNEKLGAVNAKLQAQQAEKEAAYKKIEEALHRAQETVVTRNEERSQAVRESLEKRFTKRDAAITNLRKQKMEKRKEVMEKIKTRSVGPVSPRQSHLEDWQQKKCEQKAVMDELVYNNQQRLQRANEFARDQILNRINETNARAKHIVEQRHCLQERRMQLTKTAMVEKARLEEEMRHIKVVPIQASETEEKGDEKK